MGNMGSGDGDTQPRPWGAATQSSSPLRCLRYASSMCNSQLCNYLSFWCPDPAGEFALASQIYELFWRLAILHLGFFLLRPPLMRCHHSTSSSFGADRIKRAGRCSWKECSFLTKSSTLTAREPSFLYPHMLLFPPS